MSPEVADPLATARTFLRLVICALILLTPLPFGSVQPWAVVCFEIGAVLAGGVAVCVLLRDGRRFPRPAQALLWLLGAVVAIGALQVMPLPGGVSELVVPATAAAREALGPHLGTAAADGWSPISMAPPETLDATLRLIAYVLIGLGTVGAVSRPSHVVIIAIAVVLSAAMQAVYGAAEYISGNQHIFGYAKVYFLEEATGTFINRNHFAAYLAMALPFALGTFLVFGRGSRATSSWRERLLFATRSDRIKSLFLGAFALAIMAGVLLSFSRSGLIVAVFSIAVYLIVAGVPLRQWRWVAVVLVLATITVTLYSIRPPAERFVDFGEHLPTFSGRVPIWGVATRMIPGYWPLGTGFGTFAHAFRVFRPPDIDFHTTHAHNDWLQALSEGGAGTLSCMGLALGAALLLRVPAGAGDAMTRMLHGATSASIAGIALFSAIDFPLRIPAVAVLLAAVVGMRVGLALMPPTKRPDRPQGKLVYISR